ncbi:MAG TPA: hypothetical protein DCX89_06010, partial [Saprospirales bacterium]|nr:hypothetical protein [Saprospirales bacterium]HAY71427.1 hypothetical protein [Saprospirales bacterium]
MVIIICKYNGKRLVGYNGYVYETFGISKHFPVKLQQLSIRAKTLDKPLTAKCFIYNVELNPASA